jgi:hypothetical protein
VLNKMLIFTSFPRAQIHNDVQTLIASFDITSKFFVKRFIPLRRGEEASFRFLKSSMISRQKEPWSKPRESLRNAGEFFEPYAKPLSPFSKGHSSPPFSKGGRACLPAGRGGF